MCHFIVRHLLYYRQHATYQLVRMLTFESTIKLLISQDSSRFTYTADQVGDGIMKCIQSFGNKLEWNKAKLQLRKAHKPYKGSTQENLRHTEVD